MRILIAAVAVVMLAGCSTPNDLKSNKPTISSSSSKAPKQYALCVFPKWQEERSTSTMSETEDGYRLIVATDMMTDEVLEIVKSGNGSRVALYQRMPWAKMVGRGAIEDAVRRCL
ncbi:lipoprotein [Pseudomonas sp. Z13]|uniref:lipoprotein n=1 Tax=Pseudomonas sp. Z13 TaxID=2983409 RepID=UPI002E808B86|nr:lipoprotein [Pseudomonas sp. Z13]